MATLKEEICKQYPRYGSYYGTHLGDLTAHKNVSLLPYGDTMVRVQTNTGRNDYGDSDHFIVYEDPTYYNPAASILGFYDSDRDQI